MLPRLWHRAFRAEPRYDRRVRQSCARGAFILFHGHRADFLSPHDDGDKAPLGRSTHIGVMLHPAKSNRIGIDVE